MKKIKNTLWLAWLGVKNQRILLLFLLLAGVAAIYMLLAMPDDCKNGGCSIFLGGLFPSLLVAAMIEFEHAFHAVKAERNELLAFDAIISPTIRRLVQVHICMTVSDRKQGYDRALAAGHADRCGVGSMVPKPEFRDMENMFNHVFLPQESWCEPAVILFFRLEDEIVSRFSELVRQEKFKDFPEVRDAMAGLVLSSRACDVKDRIISDSQMTLGKDSNKKTVWSLIQPAMHAENVAKDANGKACGRPLFKENYEEVATKLEKLRLALVAYEDAVMKIRDA